MTRKNNFYQAIYQEKARNNELVYKKPDSLIHFLEHDIYKSPFLDMSSKLKILEIGCGAGSVFNQQSNDKYQITAIDISEAAIFHAKKTSAGHINFKVMDITDFQREPGEYDLLFDSHCLHCLTDQTSRVNFFKNASQLLKPGGMLTLEAMVNHSRMTFDDRFTYQDNILIETNKDIRFIPHSRELEEEVLRNGFEICYLRVFETLKIIPDSQRSEALASDPDVMRVMAKRK